MGLGGVHGIDDDANGSGHYDDHADDIGLVLEPSIFGGSDCVDSLLHEDVEEEFGDDIEHDANED